MKDSVGSVREPVGAECEWWDNEPVGTLNVPVKLDSWRAAREDGGGGSEKEPVGTLKLPVNEPEGGGGREKEPVGAVCDS